MHVISFNSFTPSIEVCFAASEELAPLTVMSVQHAALGDFPVINHMLLLDLKHDLREPYVRLICSLPADEGTRCQVKIPPSRLRHSLLVRISLRIVFTGYQLTSIYHIATDAWARCCREAVKGGREERRETEEERREERQSHSFPFLL